MTTKCIADWLHKVWRESGRKDQIEDHALRRILKAMQLVSYESQLQIATAVQDAMIESWCAGWTAARQLSRRER